MGGWVRPRLGRMDEAKAWTDGCARWPRLGQMDEAAATIDVDEAMAKADG